MELKYHHSIIKAQNAIDVFNEMYRDVDSEEDLAVLLEIGSLRAFSNCREQGYIFSAENYNSGRKVTIAIAENASSDNIVVYVYFGTETVWGEPTAFPESFWDNSQYFRPYNYHEAGDYIFKQIAALALQIESDLER